MLRSLFRLRSFFLLLSFILLVRPPAARAQAAPAFDQAGLCGVPTNAASEARTRALAADALGNTYVAGALEGTVAFGATTLSSAGPGIYAAFVAKRDAAGQFVWAVGAAGAECTALALDGQGGVLVAGSFDDSTLVLGPTIQLVHSGRGIFRGKPNIFVAKLAAASGAWQWGAQAGGYVTVRGGDRCTGLAVDGQGNVVITGNLESPQLRFGGAFPLNNSDPGYNDIFVAKLDATGAWLWAVGAGGRYTQTATAVAVAPAGDVYVLGDTEDGFSVNNLPVLAGGGLLLAKLNALGQWQWFVGAGRTTSAGYTPGTSISLWGQAIAADDRYVYLGGLVPVSPLTILPLTVSGATGKALVARLDAATGACRWLLTATGPNGSSVLGLTLPRAGGRLFAAGAYAGASPGTPLPLGSTFGPSALAGQGQGDALVAEIDTAGAWRWATGGGGTRHEQFTGVAPDGLGRLHLLGEADPGPAAYGPLALTVPPPLHTSAFYFRGTHFLARMAGGPLAAAPGRAAAGFALYPNPGRGQAWVTGLPAGQAVEVRDVLGRLVLRARVPAAGPCPLALPAAHAPGVYLVRAGAGAQRLVLD